MRQRLLAFPFVVLAAAALDVAYVREAQWHRPVGVALWAQTILIWSLVTALALVPTAIRRRRAEPCTFAATLARLFAWSVGPVLAHDVLDRHTELGQDLRHLAELRPWLETAGAVVLLAVLAWLFARAFAKRGKLLTGAALLAPCLFVGLFLPRRPERFGPPPPPARADLPNLLLLVWDTTRAQSLSLYGREQGDTPHLAALAERALVFEEARSVTNYTLTSHVSMLTGRYPTDHGARMLRPRFDARRHPTVARTLRDAGYRTAAFVGTGVLRAASGLVDGFEVYDDEVDPPLCDTAAWALVHDVQSILAKLAPAVFNRDGDVHWIQDFQRPASEVLAHALEWIENGDDRPWACVINLYDAHWPYEPEQATRARLVAPYEGPIGGRLFRDDDYLDRPNDGVDGSLLDERDKRHLVELYEAELHDLDREVERFLAALAAAPGAFDSLGIVLTSDHGEAFGEGGRWEHADVLEVQVRVPFLVKPPRALAAASGAPRRIPGKVSGVDVGPTLLGLAGLALADSMEDAEAPAPGLDLACAGDLGRRAILVEDRDHADPTIARWVYYRDHWKYLRSGWGDAAREALYDLRADPSGLADVAAEHPALVAELAEEMRVLRARWHPDDQRDASDGLGVHDFSALDALGYAGRH